MEEVDQLIMIIPVVLNLNGNLEMNLSARLGTAANVGELDDPKIRRSMILGNLALLQVQTVSVSFIAACIALILGRFVPRNAPLTAPSASSNITTTAVRELLTHSLEYVARDTNTGRKSGIPTYVLSIISSTPWFIKIICQTYHGRLDHDDFSSPFRDSPWFFHVHPHRSLPKV